MNNNPNNFKNTNLTSIISKPKSNQSLYNQNSQLPLNLIAISNLSIQNVNQPQNVNQQNITNQLNNNGNQRNHTNQSSNSNYVNSNNYTNNNNQAPNYSNVNNNNNNMYVSNLNVKES